MVRDTLRVGENKRLNMTIHHDKLAYGRLARTSEELSEEKIQEMLKLLAEEENEEKEDDLRDGEKSK